MSGRKASEVNSLLANGANIRKGVTAQLKAGMRELDAAVSQYDAASAQAAHEVGSIPQHPTADEEFPDAAQKLLAAFKDAQSAVKQCSGRNRNQRRLQQEYEHLLDEYKDADHEADKIAQAVKRSKDGWYMDAEFKRADRLADRYRSLKKRAHELNRKLSAAAKDLNVHSAQLREATKQAGRTRKRSAELEQKARDIVELRKNAAAARTSVEAELKACDPVLAQKFAAEEYHDLQSDVDDYLGLADDRTVHDLPAILGKINVFRTMVEGRHAAYLAEKAATEEALATLTKRVGNRVFGDPKDTFRKGEPRQLALFEFLSEFCCSKYVADIESMLVQAQKDLQKERFQRSRDSIAKAEQLVNEAVEFAADSFENQTKTLRSALAVQKAMMGMHYDVQVEALGSKDGPFGGYTVTCTAGDECIRFEDMLVDADGQLTFGIDHKESTVGTCGGTWQNIRQSLGDEGIYIEDITKDGVSIFAPIAAGAADTGRERTTSRG